MVAGIGENAGVVDIGDKFRRHVQGGVAQPPSFVEPYQGAATGVGGIVRDILAMGARPIAVMDPLRFGALDHPDTARVLPGVVAGDRRLRQLPRPAQHRWRSRLRRVVSRKPACECPCVGVLRHAEIRLQNKAATAWATTCALRARRPVGDGMAACPCSRARPSTRARTGERPCVQVGDPFIEKLLIESPSSFTRRARSSAYRTSAGPGCPAPVRARSAGGAACTSQLDTVTAARRVDGSGGDPHERVPGAHARIVEPANLERFLESATSWV